MNYLIIHSEQRGDCMHILGSTRVELPSDAHAQWYVKNLVGHTLVPSTLAGCVVVAATELSDGRAAICSKAWLPENPRAKEIEHLKA